jgi:FkbM family methyltransferase
VIAVEMDAGNAALARRHLEPFGARCTVVHAAVWVREGDVSYGGEDAWSFHVLSPGESLRGSRRAPARTVPSLMDQFGLDRLHFVKMDVEGAEAHLLHPEAAWLSRVDMMKVEVHPPASVDACRAALETHGLRVVHHARYPGVLSGVRALPAGQGGRETEGVHAV